MSKKTTVPRKMIVTTRGSERGAFHDLFDPDEAAKLTMRGDLLRGLQTWLSESELAQTAAAKELGVT